MYAGYRHIHKDSIPAFDLSQAEPPSENRRPHVSGAERRFSMMSFGKELVLSRFTNLKMQWTMDRSAKGRVHVQGGESHG